MPMKSLLDADLGFPTFTGAESADEKCDKMQDYLYMLLENLRYTLGNLDAENFNDTGLEEIGKIISEPILAQITGEDGALTQLSLTAEALMYKIEEAEGDISDLSGKYSQIYADINSISLEVSEYGTYSTIRLTKDGATISAGIIDFSGFVTFSALEGSGTTTINGDNIVTGTITGVDFVSKNYDDYTSGRFLCIYNGFEVGAIYVDLDSNGNPSLYIDAAYDAWIDDYGNAQYASLKLFSGAGMSLESNKNIYIASGDYEAITIRAAGVLNLQAYGSHENITVGYVNSRGDVQKTMSLKDYILEVARELL